MSDDSAAESGDANLGDLVTDAEGALESLETFSEQDDFDLAALDDDTLSDLSQNLDTLAELATELESVLEMIDLSELPEAVDADEVVGAIEAEEVPSAIAEDETGVSDVIDFGDLFRAIDLLDAWDATDLGSLWEAKRDIEETTEKLTGDDGGEDGDGGGITETLIGDDDGDDDDLIETDLDGDMLETDADPTELLGDIDVMEDPEAYQVAIQQTAMEGIDSFRAALLETHAKFSRVHEFNREKMRRQDTSANSRNPTAASTMPTERADVASGVKHSTVPQQVKLSTAPSRKRIYGKRFERERKKRRNDVAPDEAEDEQAAEQPEERRASADAGNGNADGGAN
ncbi:gas-vesicle operon protein GvpI [Natrialba magadii ATCC 43099]|uniref:Gas-vesicle operon protein GvpI n=1 Tax=Natrialba magadii (strain ATCC 43099 / DSM 3394 / CCM 3739 / CIP 104546 / IAM 13178 / JCM 8861 / NBRC 102185 / NCIMB 2190 / MS3) TaxID=547559 RepID=D3SXA8_NATMM|nr:hypothetical protein [Natrialba magadii]ADD03928.1 gas-vesicle operon protein GvpI [Natrialba magadii ATCC 43099]ELY33590.1 hypothetical protein C500_02120 [Natrialba magadii ATCC 43099]